MVHGNKLFALLLGVFFLYSCDQTTGSGGRSDNRLNDIRLVTADGTVPEGVLLHVYGDPARGFDPDETDYYLKVPYTIDNVRLEAVPRDPGARINPAKRVDRQLAYNQNASIVFDVYSRDLSDVRTYTVTVRRESPVFGNVDLAAVWVRDQLELLKPIASYRNADGKVLEIDANITEYTFKVPSTVNRVSLSGKAASENAVVSGNEIITSLALFNTPYNIPLTVSSADKSMEKVYTFTVIRSEPDPTNAKLNRIIVNGQEASAEGDDLTITIEIPYSDKAVIQSEAQEWGAKIYEGGTEKTQGGTGVTGEKEIPFGTEDTISYTQTVKSESGEEKEYTVIIKRQPQKLDFGILDFSIPTADITLSLYRPATALTPENKVNDDPVTIYRTGDFQSFKLTLPAGSGYTLYGWYVDDGDVNRAASITIDANTMAVRKHYLSAVLSKEGKYYSLEIPFFVANGIVSGGAGGE